jgi:hypothetical protein
LSGGAAADAASGPPVRDVRTKVLLSATLYTQSSSAAVRIRNMSSSGAMIEGVTLPAIGSSVMLQRAELSIGADVMWSAAGRCGIKFQGSVAVPDWISGTAGKSVRSQAQVDALQAEIRSGAPARAPAPAAAVPPSGAEIDARLAEEVAYVRRLVEAMGEELVDEPVILQRHARLLQNFDIVAQVLGHVSTILTAPDREAAVQAVGMEDMRARLLRKAIF